MGWGTTAGLKEKWDGGDEGGWDGARGGGPRARTGGAVRRRFSMSLNISGRPVVLFWLMLHGGLVMKIW